MYAELENWCHHVAPSSCYCLFLNGVYPTIYTHICWKEDRFLIRNSHSYIQESPKPPLKAKTLGTHLDPNITNSWRATTHCENSLVILDSVVLIKGLITVGRELRQQHPSDLLSGDGTSQERSSRDVPAGQQINPVINPDYNMTKQWCMKHIYDKIRPKSPPNRATLPICLHCDVTHLSLTTGVVALHIPSWRIEVREERRQARKTVWPVNAGRVICCYQINLCGIINHHKHIRYCFLDV